MDEHLAEIVRSRAQNACEYCHLSDELHPGPFETEHIIPKQHQGATELSNPAYSCLHCNRHKGPNIAGLDRRSSRKVLVRLFNPRTHKWNRHFRWEGIVLKGLTPIGRVTVEVLAINDPMRMALREELRDEGE